MIGRPSDAAIERHLRRRADEAGPVRLTQIARSVAARPRVFAGVRSLGRAQGGLMAAAAVIVLAVVGASVAFRSSNTQTSGSPSPGRSSADLATVSPTATVAPSGPPVTGGARPWSDVTWARQSVDPFRLDGPVTVDAVIADGPGFLAVGSVTTADGIAHGRAWRTDDGRTWRSTDAPGLDGLGLSRLFRVGDRLVAVGATRVQGQSPTLEIRTSVDGLRWDPAPVPRLRSEPDPLSVAAGSPGMLVPDDGRIWLARPDLSTWTEVALPRENAFVRGGSFGAGEDRWFWYGATGSLEANQPPTVGGLRWSTDGANWSEAALDRPGGGVSEIRVVDGGLVALGIDHGMRCIPCLDRVDLSRIAWFSPDGARWTRLDVAGARSGDPLFAARAIGDGHRLVLLGGAFLAPVGDAPAGPMTETLDGTTWRPVSVEGRRDTITSSMAVGEQGIVAIERTRAGSSDVTEPEPWFGAATEVP